MYIFLHMNKIYNNNIIFDTRIFHHKKLYLYIRLLAVYPVLIDAKMMFSKNANILFKNIFRYMFVVMIMIIAKIATHGAAHTIPQ